MKGAAPCVGCWRAATSLGIIEIIDDTEHLYASPQLIQHGKCSLEKGSFSIGLHSTEFDIPVWEGDFQGVICSWFSLTKIWRRFLGSVENCLINPYTMCVFIFTGTRPVPEKERNSEDAQSLYIIKQTILYCVLWHPAPGIAWSLVFITHHNFIDFC